LFCQSSIGLNLQYWYLVDLYCERSEAPWRPASLTLLESGTFSAPLILQLGFDSDILLFGAVGADRDSVHLTKNDKLFNTLQLLEF